MVLISTVNCEHKNVLERVSVGYAVNTRRGCEPIQGPLVTSDGMRRRAVDRLATSYVREAQQIDDQGSTDESLKNFSRGGVAAPGSAFPPLKPPESVIERGKTRGYSGSVTLCRPCDMNSEGPKLQRFSFNDRIKKLQLQQGCREIMYSQSCCI